MMWSGALAAAGLAIAMPAHAQIQPSQFADFAFRQHPGAALPLGAQLRDESGRTVRLGSYFGTRPVVLVLEYLRCPNLCGLVIADVVAQMKEQNLRPGRDLQFVAISIDPRELPSDGAAARIKYQASLKDSDSGGWHFLTGDPRQVRRVADSVGFPYRYDKSIDQYAHPGGFIVATPEGRIAQYILGFQHRPDQLRTAVLGASKGATQPPAYPLLCLCLGYDPQPGTVQAAVLGIVRDISLALVAALVLMVVILARRSRA